VAVGCWNIGTEFMTESIIQPYGLTTHPNGATTGLPIWVMLGVAQLIWGARSWSKFFHVAPWSTIPMSAEEEKANISLLQDFFKEKPSFRTGIFDGIVEKTIIPMYQKEKVEYQGIIFPTHVAIIAKNLKDYHLFDRNDEYDRENMFQFLTKMGNATVIQVYEKHQAEQLNDEASEEEEAAS
jgi:hypothetical protein